MTATLTVFALNGSRRGPVVDALLRSQFGGVVGSDRWSAYSRFPAEQRALCHAHPKRHFQALGLNAYNGPIDQRVHQLLGG